MRSPSKRGDMDAVVADFSKELRRWVPEIAQVLPRPVTAAAVPSVEIGDAESVPLIRYSGESNEVTVRSLWQEEDGRPARRRMSEASEHDLGRAR